MSVLTLAGIVAIYFMFSFTDSEWPVWQMPEELEEIGVRVGSGFLSRELLFEDSRIGVISDIVLDQLNAPLGTEIGIAGSLGAAFLAEDLSVNSVVLFNSYYDHVDFIDVDNDGICEFMNRCSFDDAALIDHQGDVIWTYGGWFDSDSMSAGDVDGDGSTEFVVEIGGRVHLIDADGQRIWKMKDVKVWHVELIDTDGDGRHEVVHSSGSELTVRDSKGNVVTKKDLNIYFSDFTVSTWPDNDSQECALIAEDDTIWLVNFVGEAVKQYRAPGFEGRGDVRGTPFLTETGIGSHFAVVASYRYLERSTLHIYNPEGELVYHEVLNGPTASIASISLDESGADTLLVGGDGRVWKYTVNNNETN